MIIEIMEVECWSTNQSYLVTLQIKVEGELQAPEDGLIKVVVPARHREELEFNEGDRFELVRVNPGRGPKL